MKNIYWRAALFSFFVGWGLALGWTSGRSLFENSTTLVGLFTDSAIAKLRRE